MPKLEQNWAMLNHTDLSTAMSFGMQPKNVPPSCHQMKKPDSSRQASFSTAILLEMRGVSIFHFAIRAEQHTQQNRQLGKFHYRNRSGSLLNLGWNSTWQVSALFNSSPSTHMQATPRELHTNLRKQPECPCINAEQGGRPVRTFKVYSKPPSSWPATAIGILNISKKFSKDIRNASTFQYE